ELQTSYVITVSSKQLHHAAVTLTTLRRQPDSPSQDFPESGLLKGKPVRLRSGFGLGRISGEPN
ncbi:MAG: hypothetical protein AAF623_16315, partial [Planctomycetota bacterium]